MIGSPEKLIFICCDLDCWIRQEELREWNERERMDGEGRGEAKQMRVTRFVESEWE